MTKRSPLSKRTRFEVLKRDGFRCRYCGASAMTEMLHVDHVVPIARGGIDDPTNMVTACASCNQGKSDVPLDESRLKEAPSAEALAEHAEQMGAYLAAVKKLRDEREKVYDYLGELWKSATGEDVPMTLHSGFASMLDKDPIERVIKAIDIVGRKCSTTHMYEKKMIMYFYGVLRKLRETESQEA